MATQTTDALAGIIGEAEATYERGNATIDAALEKFASGKAALFRADGSAIYQDAIYDEKMAALTGELHAVAERVAGEAEAQIAAVRRLEEAGHDDPIGILSLAEQQQASARATFVREDSLLLPLPDLVRRLRGVKSAGAAKVDAYLWSRYARQRIVAEREKRGEGAGFDSGTRASLEDLTDAITALETGLGVAPALTKSQATQRVTDARRFQQGVRERVRKADGTNERIMRQMRASGLYEL